ncbi:ACT domain-containing protein ACR1 [Ananas comosus]|uniref:ACT domain-containing protein ACR n=1 Tax=Ananas comosus TaxID=4615 RepID=A0A199VZL2_ANACO|nr:ACT domain-containing protein ACR1 [Ananas comosus]
MVQVLTELDLLISKSYISSDGGWLMDVFHVTDHWVQITDRGMIHSIQQSFMPAPKSASPRHHHHHNHHQQSEYNSDSACCTCAAATTTTTTIEVAAADRPGLLSEIAAVLAALGCRVSSCRAWTHNSRAAAVLDVHDGAAAVDPRRLADIIEQQVRGVVGAHSDGPGDRMRVAVSSPSPSGRVHTERRLHQMMREDGDYEETTTATAAATETRVTIDRWAERGYWVVGVRSLDRPKLLFDTVCALTDMRYVVFHAAVGSHGHLAIQSERRRVTRCLVAAVERRVSHGLRLDVRAVDRPGLLSDVTRVFRENGLSLARAECATRGERAVGTFYVTDASGCREVDPKAVEAVRREVGGGIVLEVMNKDAPSRPPAEKRVRAQTHGIGIGIGIGSASSLEEARPRNSLGSILWSQIERLSGFIRS